MTFREAARSVFDAGLAAADVAPLVRGALADVRLAPSGRVRVVGAGKASGAMAAAAEVRSCAWQELHPPMRMKLWLCFSKSSKAGATAAEIVR